MKSLEELLEIAKSAKQLQGTEPTWALFETLSQQGPIVADAVIDLITQLKDAQDQIVKLKTCLGLAGEFIKRNNELEHQLADKDAVLDFYGDKDNWMDSIYSNDKQWETRIRFDRYEEHGRFYGGKRAREVLQKYNGEG